MPVGSFKRQRAGRNWQEGWPTSLYSASWSTVIPSQYDLKIFKETQNTKPSSSSQRNKKKKILCLW